MKKLPAWLAPFIQGRQGMLGILAFALWASILALVAWANVLLLSKIIEMNGYEWSLQQPIWPILGMNILFGLGFGLSAYGLWGRHNWGRLLFLWVIVTWSIFNELALFAPRLFSVDGEAPDRRLALEGVRFAIGPFVSLWYLNLARIKVLFQGGALEKLAVEDISYHDDVG